LIVIFPRQILRADFGKGEPAPLIGTWEKARPATEELPGLVEIALRLGPDPGLKVWVISSDVWVQSVALARNAVEGVSDEELGRALAFEAETISGLGAFDSEVGFRELPASGSEQAYLINQVTTEQRAPLEDIISKVGGKFAGLMSTTALPMPLFEADENTSWQRIELWPEAVICINAPAGQPVDVQVINDPPRQDRWRESVHAWLAGVGEASHLEWLAAPDMKDVLDEEEQNDVLDLSDSDTLEIWLAVWSSCLANVNAYELPALAPRRQPASAKQKTAIAIIVWVVILGLVGFRHMTFSKEVKETTATVEQHRLQSGQVANLRSTEKALARTRGILRKELETLGTIKAESILTNYQQRYAVLLRTLSNFSARYGADEFVIDEMSSSSGSVDIKGASIYPDPINEISALLGEKLKPFNWAPDFPTKSGLNRLPNGGPWEFTIRIRDVSNDDAETP
jgi:hypothetical protein